MKSDPQSRNLLIVDTETTGQDPFSHEVLSVALVDFRSTESIELHVELPVDAGWTEFGLKNFQRFKQDWQGGSRSAVEVVSRIEDFVHRVYRGREVHLVGHNMAFDRFFLAKLAYRAGTDAISGLSHRTIDTFSILMALHLSGYLPSTATTSSGAFDYFGIQVPPGRRHTALGDALATKELFSKIMSMVESGLVSSDSANQFL